MSKEDYSFQELCQRDLNGRLSKEEKALFDEEINDDEKREKFEEIGEVWDKTKVLLEAPEIDIDDQWRKFENIVETKRPIKVYGSLFVRILKMCAAAVIIVAISLAIYMNMEKDDKEILIYAKRGELKDIVLPDSSSIVLNSGSTIKYHEKFDDKERSVFLSGEAFFNVKEGKGKFKVLTRTGRAEVLGTKFNVWARDNETRVVVQEGRVKISALDDNDMLLERDEIGKIKNNDIIKNKINSDYVTSWTENKLVFSNTCFKEVIQETERFYNVNIGPLSDSVGEMRLTGSFDKMELDSLFEIYSLALNLEFQRKDSVYFFIEKK